PPMPEARPQHALGVRPDAARAGALARRIDHLDRPARAVDLADIIAGERREPDVAGRRDRDAVAAAPARRRPGVDLAGRRIDAAVHAVLAGEPDQTGLVEHR